MRSYSVIAIVAAIGCTGCNSARTIVPEPDKITLQDALVSTVDALNAAYVEARRPGNQIMGYYPCTVTAAFNISATGTTDNKLGLSAGGGVSGVTISANASHDDSLTGTRGNNVTVVFASSICAPAATAKSADAASAGQRAGGPGRTPSPTTNPGPVLQPPIEVFRQPLTIEGLQPTGR